MAQHMLWRKRQSRYQCHNIQVYLLIPSHIIALIFFFLSSLKILFSTSIPATIIKMFMFSCSVHVAIYVSYQAPPNGIDVDNIATVQ